MNPEALRKIWADAHRLMTEFGWKQDKVDRYIHEQTGLENLPALVAAAFPADSGEGDQKQSKVGTALTHFGHGASFGMSDELAGMLSAISGGPARNPVSSYVQGRDESRDYLQQGAQDNPGLAKGSEVGGALASGMLLPVGEAASGTDLLPAMLKAGAAGAGIGAAGAAGNVGDVGQRGEIASPSDYAQPVAAGAGLGFGLGASGALLGRTMQTTANPAAARGEEIMGAESGNPSAMSALTSSASDEGEAAVVETLRQLHVPGTPPPLLAEGGPVLRTEAAKFVARSNPKAREGAVARVKQVLSETTAAKNAAQEAYKPLNDLPVTTPGVAQLVVKWAQVLGKDRALKLRAAVTEGRPLTFRDVNDVRIELAQRSIQGFRRYKRGQVGSTLAPRQMNEAENFLDQALRHEIPEFGQVQADVAPLIQREVGLKQLLSELSSGRGRVMPSPGAGAPGHAAKELFIGATWARNARAAQRLVDVLFTPREPDAQIAALHALRKTLPLTESGVDPLGALLNAAVSAHQQNTPQE